MIINARILEYDTTKTSLGVTLEIEGQEDEYFIVSDDIAELLFDEKFSTDFHEMMVVETPYYKMITVVKQKL